SLAAKRSAFVAVHGECSSCAFRAGASSRRCGRSSDGVASRNAMRTSVPDAMLAELRIKNFAIIESLSLPLARGFNVLSGETGAGKSIIVGALGLLLGERASADVIRTGAERATVEGVFDISERAEIRSL